MKNRPGRLSTVLIPGAMLVLPLGGFAQTRVSASAVAPFSNYERTCKRSIALPRPSGPHAVGTVTYHWVDRTRPDELTANEHDDRQVVVSLFYPAVGSREEATAAYFPELDFFRAGLMTDQREVPHEIAGDVAIRGCVVTNAIADAPLEGDAAGYPLVLVSPGGNVSRHSHTALAEELASHGWIVAVMSHLHSGWDVFPEGGFVMSSPYWQSPVDASDADLARLDDELTTMLAADASFTLDRLVEMSTAQPGNRFEGRIDTSRVAIIGHSRGGSTVGRACATDDRFDACIVYDNIGPEPETDTGLSKPQLTIRRPWPEERVAELRSFLARNDSVAIDAAVDGAVHMSFTDLPLIDPDGYDAAIEPERAHRIVTALTLAFLDRYVLGESAAEFPAFPEVTVDVFGR